MRIGIPKEIKTLEGRVAMIPAAAGELVNYGHEVFLQQGAGLLSGYADADYTAVGASLVPNAKELYAVAELVIKVKEPIEPEFELSVSPFLGGNAFCDEETVQRLFHSARLGERFLDSGCYFALDRRVDRFRRRH